MKSQLDHKELLANYKKWKVKSLHGKWIQFHDIEPLIVNQNVFECDQIGNSESNIPIYKLKFGNGKKKILIWSQMHGNESTGTKAVFDVLSFLELNSASDISKTILENCTVCIVPMLNPDGAKAYTRVNANNIDLNRDAVALEAVESRLLRGVLDTFQPDFCFNLHDQRTIFGVHGTKNPASISFLAPSEDINRTITKGRIATMNVISAMNLLLQKIIPNCIGRYTDEFYPTATGDNFQKMGYNTILIEAGHYPDDYDREEVRAFNFYALLQGLYYIAVTSNFDEAGTYFDIPNNEKCFFDVIHRSKNNNDVAFLYEDSIENNTFVSRLKQADIGDLSNHYAHYEIDFEN